MAQTINTERPAQEMTWDQRLLRNSGRQKAALKPEYQELKFTLHRKLIDKINSQVGRRVDESAPMVDATLSDGSRVNAIIPPLAVDGPLLSIRRFGTDKLMPQDLVDKKSLTSGMMELLQGAVKAKLNIIIVGGTGAGKTTLLNALAVFISNKQRIVTIEDAAALQLKQPHLAR